MKFLRWLDKHFEEMLMSIFLCGIVIFMTVHVFCRYVLKSPLVWTEEATRYLFIWFVYMGISYGIRNETHVRVNIVETFFPKVILVFGWIQDLVMTAFVIYLIPAGFRRLSDVAARGTTSAGLHRSMVFVYGALEVGLLFSVVRIIQKFYFRVSGIVKGNKGMKGGKMS